MNDSGCYLHIKYIFIDVDGTMTDGCFYMSEFGSIHKCFHTLDAVAINRLCQDGYIVIFITGSKDHTISSRINSWSFKDKIKVLTGIHDKFFCIQEFLNNHSSTWNEVFFIGDAENDYKCISFSGFSACPQNAIPEIKEIVHYSSDVHGGKGAVYDCVRRFYSLNKIDWMKGFA